MRSSEQFHAGSLPLRSRRSHPFLRWSRCSNSLRDEENPCQSHPRCHVSVLSGVLIGETYVVERFRRRLFVSRASMKCRVIDHLTSPRVVAIPTNGNKYGVIAATG